MRLSVRHTEQFTFPAPVLGTIQVARLTPKDHNGHYVCNWTVEVDADCQTSEHTDAFGNIVTTFSVAGPLDGLTLRAFGEVETEQNHGIIRGTNDKVPHGVFLRPDATDGPVAVASLILSLLKTPDRESIAQLHEAKDVLHLALKTVSPDVDHTHQHKRSKDEQSKTNGQRQDQSSDATDTEEMTARIASALVQHRLTEPDDYASVFCELARQMGHPARLVSGYRLAGEDSLEKDQRDVWAEALLDDLGWIGFDLKSGTCPSEDAVRVAVGLDAPSIAPLRFSHHGAAEPGEQQTSILLRRIAT
ncbi:MAG: transglutaminase family protein [Pseudomonadota bacterium]